MQKNRSFMGTIVIGSIVALGIIILLALNLMKARDKKNNGNGTEATTPTTSEQLTPGGSVQPTNPDGTTDTEISYPVENTPFEIYPTVPESVVNIGAKSVTIQHGGESFTFSVGIENGFDRAIILNPTCDKATETRVFGYYVTYPYGGSMITDMTEASNLAQMREKGKKNVLIEHTYDCLYNAEYVDMTNFGISWAPEWQTRDEQYLDFRAIDLDSHEMVAIFRVYLVQENGKFKIGKLVDLRVQDDVAETLTALAKEAMDSGVVGSLKKDSYDNTEVLVERRDYRTYFTSFVSATKREMIYSGMISYPVYAVTVNTTVETVSYVTFYFTPRKNSESDRTSYTLLGYDCLFPFTADTIITYE